MADVAHISASGDEVVWRAGGSRRRIRRAVMTSASTMAARIVNSATVLVLVPLVVVYLGKEQYGVWATLWSLVAFLSFANLGIGNALVSLLARSDALGDEKNAAGLISSAFYVFVGIALILGGAMALAADHVPWNTVFNVSSGPLATEGGRAALVVVFLFLLGIPIGAVSQIRLGFQEGYLSALFDACGSLLSLAAVVVAIQLHASLPWLVAAVAGGPLVTSIVNWAVAARSRPYIRPRIRLVNRAHAQLLLRSGGLFLALQFATVIGYSTDNFVAAQVLGPKAVTDYAVPSRLAFAGLSLLAMLSAPLWPAYAEALAKGDFVWVARILRRSLLITGACALVAAIVFVAFGPSAIGAWSAGRVHPGFLLLLGLGCWIVLGTGGAAVAMVLNAAHIVSFQVICSLLMAFANLGLSIFLAQRIGVAGLIWGTVISYALFVALPYVFVVPRIFRQLSATAA